MAPWTRRQGKGSLTPAQRAVKRHIADFFHPQRIRELSAPRRTYDRVPGYTTFLVEPRGTHASTHVYVTAGCWDQVHSNGHGLEFVLIASNHSPAHVVRLAMAAFYHC